MNNSPNLRITKHAIIRFIERTGASMSFENARSCVLSLTSEIKRGDLIPWDDRSQALRNTFGLFIIFKGYIVTFLSWSDLHTRQRKLLQDLVLGF